MNTKISLVAFGHATGLFLAITFALCVAFDVLFPEYAMFTAWQMLLPGFTGINWSSFFIGLIEAYGYGWYTALIWVPLYNVASARGSRRNLNDA
ncbi:MAG TPA: DUF5676 family membrane protein [Mariprofundaceae bacterium]|nr:DUF5676 family membrane protein [Mariprofundaceae bacterium]